MKLRWKIAIGCVVLLGLIALWMTITHYRAKNRLAAYRKQLVAQGEKLTSGELSPRVPESQSNGAQNLMAAAAPLGLSNSNYLPIATMMASGHARVSWQQAILPTKDMANLWPQFTKEFEDKRDAIAKVRTALEKPVLFFPLNYNQGFSILLPHLARLKMIEFLLAFSALQQLRQTNSVEAWKDLRASGVLVRSFGQAEPLAISQLVRTAMANIGINTTWEALQYQGWTEEQLAGLQQIWDSFSLLDELEPSLAMERSMGQELFPFVRDSFGNVQSVTGLGSVGTTQSGFSELAELGKGLVNDPVEGFQAVLNRYPRYWAWKGWWSYDEEICYLEGYQAGIDAIRVARKSQAWAMAVKELNNNLNNVRKSHFKVEKRYLLGATDWNTSNFLLKIADAETARRLLVTAIALKRYQLKNGAYPKELRLLVPDYLTAVPIDLMDGKTVRYRANADGTFLLYSVGEDGKDNGGDTSEKEPQPTSGRMPRHAPWFKRRDAVWPVPASAEEVKAYQDQVLKNWKMKEEFRKQIPTNLTGSNAMQLFRERYGVSPSAPAKTN